MEWVEVMGDLKEIAVSKVFTDKSKYLIPIYQRNYAWEETQIEQLIDDIDSYDYDSNGKYFLGSLIVNKTDNDVYEVIDGQQRLTTLFLLKKCLGDEVSKEALQFEVREKSNKMLSKICDNNNARLINESDTSEIMNGFKIIYKYFSGKKSDKDDKDAFKEKLEKVCIIRIQVPKNIDLNHYFEIMNTRGEQLELHEIAKAKLLEKLEDQKAKNLAAMIWEKCSDMNSYIQMNFDTTYRENIFSDDWSDLKKEITDFDSMKKAVEIDNKPTSAQTLIGILRNLENGESSKDSKNSVEKEENERFESAISFPNFLLQVSSVMPNDKGNDTGNDTSLDDKKLLDNLSREWSSAKDAKEFLFHLLKCRVLFDKYVLKREFAADKDKGKWSLKSLKKSDDNKRTPTPTYSATFKDDDNKKLKTLQSCLRITYTSPKTMHWITKVLEYLLKQKNEATAEGIIGVLESYCNEKIKQSDYRNKDGFGFERIVFSYLDYLIYRDGYSFGAGKKLDIPETWEFQFRNSIEHFQPQNPSEEEGWDKAALDEFGNLALITVSGNSKLSNLPPDEKIKNDKIINQSLKLKIMAKMTRDNKNKWTKKRAEDHENEMFGILDFEVAKHNEETIN